MKKKLTMLLASLFLVLGTAWAQTVITDIEDLTNDMECTVSTSGRGGWAVKVDKSEFGSTNDYGFGTTVDPFNNQHVFQFKKHDGKIYLFSVYAQKYVNKDRSMSETYADAIEFIPQQSENTFVVKFDDSHYVNLGGDKQMVINSWGSGVDAEGNPNQYDVGNKVTITDLTSLFRPQNGKSYVLKSPTDTYFSFTTSGTTAASFQAKPTYFYITRKNGGYVFEDCDNPGKYISMGGNNWDVAAGSSTIWHISRGQNGYIIKRSQGESGIYLGSNVNTSVGTGIFTNVPADNYQEWQIKEAFMPEKGLKYALKSPSGTYFNFTASGNTAASFQSTPTYFNIKYDGGAYTFEDWDNPGKYISKGGNDWDVVTSSDPVTLWSISELDDDGYVNISRIGGVGGLGHDGNTNISTGIYLNAGSQAGKVCNKWFIEGIDIYADSKPTFTDETGTIRSYGQYLTALSLNDVEIFSGRTDPYSTADMYVVAADAGVILETGTMYTFNLTFPKNQTSQVLAANIWIDKDGNGTYETHLGTQGEEKSNSNNLSNVQFTIPTDAAEGITRIRLRLDSSWGIVDEANANANRMIYDIPVNIIKKVVYTFKFNNQTGQDVDVVYDGNSIETDVTIENLDVTKFDIPDISGYVWDIIVDEENYTVTLVYTEAPATENPEAVVALVNRIGGDDTDDKFKFVLDPSINSKQETFVLGSEDDKILIKGTTISAITTGLGWYLNNVAHINISWNSLNEKTVSGDAYVDLSEIVLPLPSKEETHTSDAKYRYYLNYCTFGYSMTSWTWKRWQQEIDWMALHGINMPLQIVGLEEVWRRFLTMEKADGTRKYNYTDEEAMAFVPGPAYTAWWGMNNLQGWGGTGAGDKIQTAKDGTVCEGTGGVQNKAWFDRQLQLATDILARQRELGMKPVLPGFSGMVPSNFTEKTGVTTDQNNVDWQSFLRPSIIDPTAARFAEIAEDYYTCLKEVMGESQYYSMDPFHEGGSISSDLYSEAYSAIYEAMEAAQAGSQWVIQQWHWTDNQKKSTSAVPAGRLIVLDLFSDGRPGFSSYGGYNPQDAVFCAIPNFGGRSGLMGRLQNVTDNYFSFKGEYRSIKGIGTAPEAIEQTPITYDLIYQLPWMNGAKPNVEEWVNNYAVARYGKDNAVVKEAWSLLRQSVLNYGADGIEGPIEDVWAARPNLDALPASKWGKTMSVAINTYTKARHQMLIDAVYKLIDQQEELELQSGSVFESNYLYDVVEFGGGVMADYAYYLLLGIRDAKNAGNTELFNARRDAFLALLEDVDAFKGTNLNFRLGKWTQEARDAAKEVNGWSKETQDWYEFNNARTLVTTWTYKIHGLNDYSYRSWQGLMKDYYLPRWKYFFDNDCTHPNGNRDNYFYFEWNWAHGKEHYVGQTGISNVELTADQDGHTSKYTREPKGNTVEEAVKMLGKYIIPVTVNGTTHYAYRYLDNDVSSMATIPANAGATVDLTPYFGELTGISSFDSDVVDGTVTDLSSVAIKADAADGAHSATITLNDGTKLTFYFSMNPKFNGVYTINYKNGNADAAVFVGYNEDKDNVNNVGYKLIATGTYSTTATGDKYFTIIPSGVGFNVSAQGKYLKAPNLNAWNHVMFSDNQGDAGVYLFEEVETELYKMRDPNNEDKIKYINDYDKLVFGNDKAGKENLATFTITKAETYPLTVTAAGMATLCLPFNVVLPKSVTAYDLVVSKIVEENDAQYVAYLQSIATSDKILKAGTPVIVKAEQGSYDLAITMSNENAVSSLANSLLKGNFVSQILTQGADVKKFIFANGTQGVGFYIMDAEGIIGANKCWMEWAMPADANVRSLVLRFSDDATDIEYVAAPQKPAAQAIYNLAGQRLEAPQKGVNIINGKKVVIK